MSAPNPTGGEREFDALRRAQRAHEPSMEEILASIRAIIADDRVAETAKPVAAPKPAASAGPQIVYSNDSAPSLRAVSERTIRPPRCAPFPNPSPSRRKRKARRRRRRRSRKRPQSHGVDRRSKRSPLPGRGPSRRPRRPKSRWTPSR
jgi:cell pole-organizing protein PopZ